MSDNNKNARTVLIMGASSGFGVEFAKLFAKDGYNLVLVARSEKTMLQQAQGYQKNYKVAVKIIAKDLTQPHTPQEIFD